MRDDVVRQLGMRDPRVLVHGFQHVKQAPKPGIAYVDARRLTSIVRDALTEAGVRAIAYHAGMSAVERERAHGDFMPSSDAVMVATNAFGMGIDKPDVRFLVHDTPSDSLDAYDQERAPPRAAARVCGGLVLPACDAAPLLRRERSRGLRLLRQLRQRPLRARGDAACERCRSRASAASAREIAFQTHGKRELSLALAVSRGFLRPAAAP